MGEKIDLNKIEKQSFTFIFRTGMVDIMIGLTLVGVSIGPFLSGFLPTPLNVFIPIVPAIMIYLLGVRYITGPRMGIVRFGEKRKRAQKKLMGLMITDVGLTALSVAWSMAVGFQSFLFEGLLCWLLLGLLFATLPISVIAYFKNFPRLYLYGALVGVGVPITTWLTNFIEYSTASLIVNGSIGVVFSLNGLLLLIRFVQKYPKPKEVENHSN